MSGDDDRTPSVSAVSAMVARIGCIGRTAAGVTRLALTPDDCAARKLVVEWAVRRGRSCQLDEFGNLFALPSGGSAGLVLTGSHLDTQPDGGQFDGVFGVVAGMAAIDGMVPSVAQRVALVVWCNEEGVRFAPTTMGSGAYSGALDADSVLGTRDASGVSVAEAVGFASTALELPVRAAPMPLAYVEAHIEQGPLLEDSGCTVGVVEGAVGIVWLEVLLTGVAGHAGTVPMDGRKDALLAACYLVTQVDSALSALDSDLRWTIGSLSALPGSPNTIAGSARFTIDLRGERPEKLDRACRVIAEVVRGTATCSAVVNELSRHLPVRFDPQVVGVIEQCCEELGIPSMRMTSKATHDARHLAELCPTAMLFVPSHSGISHHPDELTSGEDLESGARVLEFSLSRLVELLDT